MLSAQCATASDEQKGGKTESEEARQISEHSPAQLGFYTLGTLLVDS